MKSLVAAVVTRESLENRKIEEMFGLYRNYFEATHLDLFRTDLENKDWIILLHDDEDRLRGFSTLSLDEFVVNGQRGRFLFSGDTIIHHECWGSQGLSLAFISHAGRLKERYPDEPLYWLLISKGYRTYRYLPVCFREFYPRFDRPTPKPVQEIIDHLALHKFGEAYDPGSGVVRFSRSRGQLREAWAEIPEAMASKPEVRFFLEKNPGYRDGHELVCLTEIADENIRGFGRRSYLEGADLKAPVAR